MKRIYILQISIAFSFCLWFNIETAIAQRIYPSVSIENTELHTITSKNVPDQTFQIKIDLPESYFKSDSILFPVLYLTDADYLFGSATDMMEYLRWGGFMGEVIIVGIAYGSKGEGNMRSRDFSTNPDKDGIIGANYFLAFMTNELFPFIEKEYRVNNDDKTLFGFSAGANFGTYVLFTKPEIFNRYIICSPVVGDQNRWAFKLEEQYFQKRKDLPVKVYMSIGAIESYYPPFPDFVNIIESRNYKGLELKVEHLKNGRHMAIPSESLSHGLKYIYSQESIYELMINYIQKKGLDFAIKKYYELKQLSHNQYNFTESELNDLGYFLLRLNKIDDAIKIFTLNIESYPKSWNCYDSLGEAYLQKGDKKSAIKNYEKALELNPGESYLINVISDLKEK
jgi:predicted alpha/beta superfamily hydrolase